MIVIDEVGSRAAAALAISGGHARVVSRTTTSLWLDARGEIVWLGSGPMHPRAVIPRGAAMPTGDDVALDLRGARPWRPPSPAVPAVAAPALRDGARRLRGRLDELGPLDGLAHLVAPAPHDPAVVAPAGVLRDVLARAAPHVTALAGACARDVAEDAVAPAVALLGLGPGLTPSGDDVVGGLFFGRRLLALAGAADAGAWTAAGDRVRAQASERTHRISHALLGDLLDGASHAPLHALVDALAAGDDPMPAARALTRIGHSSGWDILAGLLVALASR